jgi:hypothetical protein
MQLRIGVVCALVLCGALAAGPLRGDSISVQNPSFETANALTIGCGAGCAYNFGPIPDWTITGTGGSWEPNSTYYTSVPDGSIVAFSNGGTISQTLSGVSLLPDTTYTLSVDVGHRLDNLTNGYSITLDAGSTILDSIFGDSKDIPAGTFATEGFSFTTGSSVTPGDLSIILASGAAQNDFDNVRLTDVSTSSVSTPEPSTLLLLAIALGCLALMSVFSNRKTYLNATP